MTSRVKEKVKLFFHFRKNQIIDTGIILFLGLLSITWFRGDNLISGGDFSLPLDWVRQFRASLSSWEGTISLGLNPYFSHWISLSALCSVMQLIGFSPLLFEKLLFYFWFVFFLFLPIPMIRDGNLRLRASISSRMDMQTAGV